ncbi:hypothetical protein DPMN_191233 [Dreissena polymorpha]|uniref:Uncharacterized protein n=1 Tax=Dreissena polymorpha TaxID=45954 RepID=A0A9D4B609_DREPO|nr:hypothetical protein DPMN_191233 [Dreissena polymorpha]
MLFDPSKCESIPFTKQRHVLSFMVTDSQLLQVEGTYWSHCTNNCFGKVMLMRSEHRPTTPLLSSDETSTNSRLM